MKIKIQDKLANSDRVVRGLKLCVSEKKEGLECKMRYVPRKQF